MKSRTTMAALVAGSLALSSLASPSVSLAQDRQNTMPRAPVGSPARITGAQESWRYESEEMRRRNTMTPEEAEAEYGPERVALANRVQALIDEGRCREARAMANEAGERRMALRIRQTCRAR
jgi:hypothetical protein